MHRKRSYIENNDQKPHCVQCHHDYNIPDKSVVDDGDMVREAAVGSEDMCNVSKCSYAGSMSLKKSILLSYTLTLYSPAGRPVVLTDPLSLSSGSLCSVLLKVSSSFSNTTNPVVVELMKNVHFTNTLVLSVDTKQR